MDAASRLDERPAYVPDWSLERAPEGVRDWVAFWSRCGIEVEPSERVERLARRLGSAGRAQRRAAALRELLLDDLAKDTNAALDASGRAERIFRQVTRHGELVRPTRWVLMTAADRDAIEGAGVAHFGSPRRALTWMLSTLPLVVAFWGLLLLGLTRDGRYVYGAVATWIVWLVARRWARRRAAVYEAAPRR